MSFLPFEVLRDWPVAVWPYESAIGYCHLGHFVNLTLQIPFKKNDSKNAKCNTKHNMFCWFFFFKKNVNRDSVWSWQRLLELKRLFKSAGAKVQVVWSKRTAFLLRPFCSSPSGLTLHHVYFWRHLFQIGDVQVTGSWRMSARGSETQSFGMGQTRICVHLTLWSEWRWKRHGWSLLSVSVVCHSFLTEKTEATF